MNEYLSENETREIIANALAPLEIKGKKILLIVPDSTRTAPVGLMFRCLYDLIGEDAKAVDVMIALGTHPPMSDEAINQRLEISAEERAGRYGRVRMLNHAWDDPAALVSLGVIPAGEIAEMTAGSFKVDVPVTINRAILDYDHLFIVGPVFPHEIIGFSGGNKYLFPGISGAEILHFFHWQGAVLTSPKVIGHKWTPVRKVVDRAAALVPVPTTAFCMVVYQGQLAGLYAGKSEEAWSQAADLSGKVHVVVKDHPFHTVLSCPPLMYDDLWTGAKSMYKLEPVVADGGEIIIYAPHIRDVSKVHGEYIERYGYHTRDYFMNQWDRFKDEPWGLIAHSTHVRGIGTYENGVEKPRIQVTLATGISEEKCRAIGLGYRDPASIHVEDYQGREDEGILYVPKAGETLYRLKNPPEWAQG